MKILVNELISERAQKVTATRDMSVAYVRPHLLKVGAPAGNLKLELRDANGRKIAESGSVSIASISTQNFHGYVRFDVSWQFEEGQTYEIALVPSGYSFLDSDYIGWVAEFENKKYDLGYTINGIEASPLDMELWESKQRVRGA